MYDLLAELDAELVEMNPYLSDEHLMRGHGAPRFDLALDNLLGREQDEDEDARMEAYEELHALDESHECNYSDDGYPYWPA